MTSGASTNWPSALERGAHLIGGHSTNADLQDVASIREGDDSAAVGERQPDPRIGERNYELVTIGAIHELAIRTIHMLVNQRDPRVGERQRDP